MSFGLLSSVSALTNINTTLYTSPVDTLTQGKVSITNKNYNPIKIRLGLIDAGSSDINYLEYNRYIKYGETFETGEINVGSEQQLMVRTDSSGVNFVLTGSTVSEVGAQNYSGYLNSVLSTSNSKQILYTSPANTTSEVYVSIVNRGTFPSTVRIGMLPSGVGLNSFDIDDYIEYGAEIPLNSSYVRPVKLAAGQSIVCSSSPSSNLQFVAHGKLTYTSP